MLQDRLGVSERRACRYAGQHRSTQRREPCVTADDAALRGRLRELSRERPRWGYRRAHAMLCEEGWSVIACIGFASSPTDAICIPLACGQDGASYRSADDEVRIFALLHAVLTACPITFHNAIWDMQVIGRR